MDIAGSSESALTQPCGIERVHARDLSSREFIQRFAEPGRPVVLLDIVTDWPAFRWWRDECGKPNYRCLAESFGGLSVPVIDCASACKPQTWTAQDYFTWAAARQPCGTGMAQTGGSSSASSETAGKDGEMAKFLYLKDWHFARDCRVLDVAVPYSAPEYLAAPLHDWLNLYMDVERGGKDDYRFCYVGVAGTSTPMHHDVLFSHSWSANISGRKRWVFFPPEVSGCLLNARGEAVPDAVPERRPEGWERHFPRLSEAWSHRLEVIQESGELVFVPSGWHHQVENLTDAISINHNWLNASNARGVWRFLQGELDLVTGAIEDLRETFDSPEEFEAHCQVMMRANCGLDCRGWLTLLALAAAEVSRALTAEASAASAAADVAVEGSIGGIACNNDAAIDRLWTAQWVAVQLREVAASTLAHATSQAPEAATAVAQLAAAMAALPMEERSEDGMAAAH